MSEKEIVGKFLEEMESVLAVGKRTRKKDVIEATKKAYEIKSRYLPLMSIKTIEEMEIMKSPYCPMCKKYLNNGVCGKCPLKEADNLECCVEWRKAIHALYEAIETGRKQEDFFLALMDLKKRIDAL